jgi:hypothetical protein
MEERRALPLRSLVVPQPNASDYPKWDSTFVGTDVRLESTARCFTLCRHATAHDTFLFKTNDPKQDAYHDSTSSIEPNPWWSWHKYLGPHKVIAVASNRNGSIISAATDDATVYLLRGRDGEILASRKVCQTGRVFVAKLVWLDSIHDNERLLIELRSRESNDLCEDGSGFIIVTNIKSELLNGYDPSLVEDAACAMVIKHIKMICCDDVVGIVVCSTEDDNKLQFLSCNTEGLVSTNYYNMGQQEALEITKGVQLFNCLDEFSLDVNFGFRYLRIEEQVFYTFAANCSSDNCSAVLWINPLSTEQICQYKIPSARNNDANLRVAVIEEVKPFSTSLTYALAIGCMSLSKEAGGKVIILQILIDRDTNGLIQLTKPHIVYSIPLEQPLVSICLVANENQSFGFRMKVQMSNFVDCEYSEFCPHEESSLVIGQIRRYIQNSEFDLADKLVSSSGIEFLVNEKYSRFNPSEVALARIQHSFSIGAIDVLDLTKICLRQLAMGTMSNDLQGIKYYFIAVDCIFKAQSKLELEEYLQCLDSVVTSVANVQSTVGHEHKSFVSRIQQQITSKVEALRFLLYVSEPKEELVGIELNNVESCQNLFCLFIEKGRFRIAKKLLTSAYGAKLDAADLINPFLDVDETVLPIEYLPLLKEIILSKLAINHNLFHRLQVWCVELADAIDDAASSPSDLAPAISLLQVSKVFFHCASNLFVTKMRLTSFQL